MFFPCAKTNNVAFITNPVFCPFFPHLGFPPIHILSQSCREQKRLNWVDNITTCNWTRRICQTPLIHRDLRQCRHRLSLCPKVHLPMPPSPLRHRKRNMSVARVSVRSLPVGIWLVIPGCTLVSATTSVRSLVVRRVVRARTTYNNSKFRLS